MTVSYSMQRGWQRHDLFAGDVFSRRDAWSWMIGEAAAKAHTIDLSRQPVTLARGQFCHSYRFMAGVWGWSLGRVQDFIASLKNHTMVTTDVINARLVVTLCNYDKFQAVSVRESDGSEAVGIRKAYESHTIKKDSKEVEDSQQNLLPPLVPPGEKHGKSHGGAAKRELALDPDMLGWIAENTPGIDAVRELAAHRDWKAATGRTYRDDRAGFRTWCRRAQDRTGRNTTTPLRNGNGHGRGTTGPATGIADGFAEALAQRQRDEDRSGDLPFDGPFLGRS